MIEKPSNTAAFPGPGTTTDSCECLQGCMSLRDYFAAAALPAVIKIDMDHDVYNTTEEIVQDAYFYADAMLKARG